MSLTKFNGDTNNIQGLADKPTQSASDLKAKFDKVGEDLKKYINETLTAEIDTELAKKADSSSVYTKTQIDAKIIYTDIMINTNYYNSNFASKQGSVLVPNGYAILNASIIYCTTRNVATITILDVQGQVEGEQCLVQVSTFSPDISTSNCTVKVRVTFKKNNEN